MKNSERSSQNEALPKNCQHASEKQSNHKKKRETRRKKVKVKIYRNLLLLFYHFCRAAVYSAAGEFVLLEMKLGERKASRRSNRM